MGPTQAVTEELCPGTRSIIKVDATFMIEMLIYPTESNQESSKLTGSSRETY
jgi:hypothetical protein